LTSLFRTTTDTSYLVIQKMLGQAWRNTPKTTNSEVRMKTALYRLLSYCFLYLFYGWVRLSSPDNHERL